VSAEPVRGTDRPIYVLCVAYESSRHLPALLGSLAAEPVHRVLVWDNSVRPAERASLRAAAAVRPDTEVLGCGQNLGFGKAVNRLVEHVPATSLARLWILNPDTVVRTGTVRSLADALDRCGPRTLVSPVIRKGAAEESVWFAGGTLDTRRGRTAHDTDVGAEGLRPCTFLTGAALMVDAAAWRALGGFREDLFLYWEDADLCRRALNAGYGLYVVNDTDVWHAVGGSGGASGRSADYYYYMNRNRLVLAADWGSRWRWLAGSGLPETLRLALRAGRENDGRRRKVAASFRGVGDGIRGRTGPQPAVTGNAADGAA
jgi:hypothetical protein